MFTSPPALPTGALRPPQEGEGAGTLSYIEVKDVSKTLRTAEEAGAKVLVPKTEIPNMGHFAVLLIPRGDRPGDLPECLRARTCSPIARGRAPKPEWRGRSRRTCRASPSRSLLSPGSGASSS
jgi:hypothetical protein